MSLPLRTAIALLIVMLLCGSNALRAQSLTIYRCIDAHGKQTLRDSPCKRGEKQHKQTMLRPRDAMPATIRHMDTPRRHAPETVRYIVQPAPRPLYACMTPDGQQYLSESAEGTARWSSAWATDHRPHLPRRIAHPGTYARNGGLPRYIAGAPVIDLPPGPSRRLPLAISAGYWTRDACSPLSPSQTCSALAERRHAISRRYAQVMPSERRLLDSESATLDSRLRQECGG